MPTSSSSHVPHGRRRLAVDLDEDLWKTLDDAVRWLKANTPYRYTKVGIVTRGLELALAELARRHNLDGWPPADPHGG